MKRVPELFVRRRQEPELPKARLLTKVALFDPSSTMKPLPSVRRSASVFSNEMLFSIRLVPVASNSVTPLDHECALLLPLCAEMEFLRWNPFALKNVKPVRPFEYEMQASISQCPFDTSVESTPPAQPLPKPMLQPRDTRPTKRTYSAVSEPTPLSCTSAVGAAPAPSMIGVAHSSAL